MPPQNTVEKVLLTPFWLIATTFIGLGDTLYLSYYHLLGIIPTCAVGGCEIVLSSPYATPFGVPFAYLGLFYYICMLGLATFLAIKPLSQRLRFYVLAYAAIGLFCSMCFELFQYIVIHALCLYCGLSAVTTLILFAIAVWHWKTTQK